VSIPDSVRLFGRLAAYALALSTACAADAAVFDVDTTADLIDDDTSDGLCQTSAKTCSLRAAIMQVNHSTTAGVTVINLPEGTYLFTREPNGGTDEEEGDLNLMAPLSAGQNVVIVGAGAARTIIDANHLEGVLRIEAGRTVSIDGVTFRNGETGGGLVSFAIATVSNCVFENNSAVVGGGGIDNLGTMDIVRTTIRSNVAGDFGGGLLVHGPTMLRDSTISGNGADNGGGILVANSADHLYVVESTISGNYAYNDGGGIFNQAAAFLYNASVVNNDADHDRDENGGVGGGLYTDGFSRFVVVNTLIAGNTERDAPIPDNCYGAFEAYGVNLLDDQSGCTSTTTAANFGFVSAATIGPLQDNGGPTLTHPLLAGSEAIDGTRASQACIDFDGSPLATDQRGAPRIAGARCDVGATEYGAAVPVLDVIFHYGFDVAL